MMSGTVAVILGPGEDPDREGNLACYYKVERRKEPGSLITSLSS